MDYLESCNILINQFLFNNKISSIHTISYQIYNGLLLNSSLVSNENLRNINLTLQTIDDLYILLEGLVPLAQTMSITLCQARVPCKSSLKRLLEMIRITISSLSQDHRWGSDLSLG